MEIKQDYLDKFKESLKKIKPPATFWEPDFTDVRKTLVCPYSNCGRKLYLNLQKTTARCKNKNHPRVFITLKVLNEIKK